MNLHAIEAFVVRLPFRISFGHGLASRNFSENIIVRVALDNGIVGYGEGIPRDYVTGEDIASALGQLQSVFAPRFLGADISNVQQVVEKLQMEFADCGLKSKARGAAWCALELAILDAAAKLQKTAFIEWFKLKQSAVRYGAVVPFARGNALRALLYFYKFYGFETLKLKVGLNLQEDLERLRLIRQILGNQVKLRVDANCCYSLEQAMQAAEQMRKFNVLSIEQPLAANDIAGLGKLTAELPEDIIVDESLCTLQQAVELVEAKACNGFNIRISKVGGLLAAAQMHEIASKASLSCHMGAQVGESAILSAAGRIFACANEAFANYEGSDNAFLLKRDIGLENFTVGLGGWGKLQTGSGLGVTVPADKLAAIKLQRGFCLTERRRQVSKLAN